MLLIFLASLFLITFGCAVFHYVVRLNSLVATAAIPFPQTSCRTYKPMLRLLSEDDFQFVASSPALRKQLRARRRQIFRSYLRCLARDYSRLFSGVRWIMVNSNVDRPDLAILLSRQRRAFALALCRIEWKLALHAAGFEHVKFDVSGMVSALDNLTGIVNVFTPAAAAAA